jgi:hypothetical protein
MSWKIIWAFCEVSNVLTNIATNPVALFVRTRPKSRDDSATAAAKISLGFGNLCYNQQLCKNSGELCGRNWHLVGLFVKYACIASEHPGYDGLAFNFRLRQRDRSSCVHNFSWRGTAFQPESSQTTQPKVLLARREQKSPMDALALRSSLPRLNGEGVKAGAIGGNCGRVPAAIQSAAVIPCIPHRIVRLILLISNNTGPGLPGYCASQLAGGRLRQRAP